MKRSYLLVFIGLSVVPGLFAAEEALPEGEDPYLAYVKKAPEFQRVKQDPEVMIGRWDTWIYMPWRYQWSIGTGDEGGRFCKDYGFNGGFTDHGNGPFDWLNKWQLRFYNDHTAAKGCLYLHRKNDWKGDMRNPRVIRNGARGPQPLNDAKLQELKGIVSRYAGNCMKSPYRVAYALDDEISWGSFVKPIGWRLNDDDAAYERWLKSCYGGPDKAPKPQYVTPDDMLKQLGRPVSQIDFSPLMDRITYNDSVWANFLGALVEHCNTVDPETPCGFVGGQSPNMWGGYDYAKLMKKIQFIEAYNLGSSQAVIRSFNPQNALPQVTTHFHNDGRGTVNDIWQTWYYFAHGNRGMIGWVERWFDGNRPRKWLEEYKDTNLEVGGRQGSKMVGSRWIHDGVAIYYSHPSIQVSWLLDIEPHGSTWVNRNGDSNLGTAHLTRKAWENILTDSGIQYSFVPYDEVVVDGVPSEYRVLILPACYALSDIEARRITEFCEKGGTVIADFCCGMFDHHGKGRTKGALDDLFGVRHDGTEAKQDFFSDKLWVETDQDAGFSYKRLSQLFGTLSPRLEEDFAVAEKRLPTRSVREVGRGRAIYLNLSPQRYLMYREERRTTDAQRALFMKYVYEAGARSWVRVTGADGRRPTNCEVTYWYKPARTEEAAEALKDRTLCFVVQNAAVSGSELGGGGVEGLLARKQRIMVDFDESVRDVVNERTDERLGNGRSFQFDFNGVEAVFFSFEGRGGPAVPSASAGRRTAAPAVAEAAEKPPTPEELNEWGIKRVRHAQRSFAGGKIWAAADALKEVIQKVPEDQPAHKEAKELLSAWGL